MFVSPGSRVTRKLVSGNAFYSQATAPSNPSVGDEWFDTTTAIYYSYIYDGDTYQWVEIGPTPAGNGLEGYSLSASVGSSALTITLKDEVGNDATSSNLVRFKFRDPTATTGTPVWRTLVAANSLVVSSGSTLGTVSSSVPFRLWIVLFDDGGTLRLGVINCRVGGSTPTQIVALDDGFLLSSTAEGGAGAADTAGVIYTGTAVTTKAIRILGYMDWASGLATAGTWASGPTTIQLFGQGVHKPGDTVQSLHLWEATGSSTTSGSQTDVTNATKSITPTAAANCVQVDLSWVAQISNVAATNTTITNQVLRGATAISGTDAFPFSAASAGGGMGLKCGAAFHFLDAPGTTSSTTYKMQHKSSVGTATAFTTQIGMRLTEIMG